MSFVNILRKVGLIAGVAAPEIISMVNPAVGAIAQAVLQSIVLAESRSGSGNGELKKQDAMISLQVALPLLLQMMATGTGKPLADQDRLTSGLEKLNDGLVEVLNAFRILPKS